MTMEEEIKRDSEALKKVKDRVFDNMTADYKPGDTIYILMEPDAAEGLVEDWFTHGYECDMRLKKSEKTPGKVVMITTDMMWASRVIRWHKYLKVTYRRMHNSQCTMHNSQS